MVQASGRLEVADRHRSRFHEAEQFTFDELGRRHLRSGVDNQDFVLNAGFSRIVPTNRFFRG